jgi:hypothetical protein
LRKRVGKSDTFPDCSAPIRFVPRESALFRQKSLCSEKIGFVFAGVARVRRNQFGKKSGNEFG